MRPCGQSAGGEACPSREVPEGTEPLASWTCDPACPHPPACGISEEDQRGPLERWGQESEALHRDLGLPSVWVGRPGSLPRAAPPAPRRTRPRPDAGPQRPAPAPTHPDGGSARPQPLPRRTHLMSWSALALAGPRQKPLHPTQQLFEPPSLGHGKPRPLPGCLSPVAVAGAACVLSWSWVCGQPAAGRGTTAGSWALGSTAAGQAPRGSGRPPWPLLRRNRPWWAPRQSGPGEAGSG